MGYILPVNILLLSLGLALASAEAASKRTYGETAEPSKGWPWLRAVSNKSHHAGTTLGQHEFIDRGVRTHTCQTCHKEYSSSRKLKFHMYKHTGERPYECPSCGKVFTRPDILAAHMYVHTDERPYECDDCGSTFKRPWALTRHRQTHTKDLESPVGTVLAGSPKGASAPILTLSAISTATADHVSPVDSSLPQNQFEMDKLDSLLEKFPWKNESCRDD